MTVTSASSPSASASRTTAPVTPQRQWLQRGQPFTLHTTYVLSLERGLALMFSFTFLPVSPFLSLVSTRYGTLRDQHLMNNSVSPSDDLACNGGGHSSRTGAWDTMTDRQ